MLIHILQSDTKDTIKQKIKEQMSPFRQEQIFIVFELDETTSDKYYLIAPRKKHVKLTRNIVISY